MLVGIYLISILVILLLVGVISISQLRQRYLIAPLYKHLQQQMPTMSATEQIAIESGDTWWEKELFTGRPDWAKLLNFPAPVLTPAEEHFLNHQVEQLCDMINDWQDMHEMHNLSAEVWAYLKKEKFFGVTIPQQYGGLAFSAFAHANIVTKIATRSISAAVTTMVPNSLGPAELLLHYGTEAQKNYYLPRLATGSEIPCFALTGPDAGSDAGAIPDKGIICRGQYEGKEILGIRLNWDKRYITLAPIATLLGLAFHLYDPEHLLGEQTDIGISVCLIPTSHPGVELGHRHYPMYLAFMNGPIRGKDVFVPLDWLIGGIAMAGQGWRMLMECLSIGRSISLPALAAASCKMVYRFTGAYAKVRRQFNLPLAAFEGIEEALGNIAGQMYLLEACRTVTVCAVDQKIRPAIASAITKYHATEISRAVVAHGMDVHAGQMVQLGPRNFLANIYATVPICTAVEGANILTRNLIIFGQGVIRCHPYLLAEIKVMTAPQPDIAALDKLLVAHTGFFICNFLRSFVYGLTGGLWIVAPLAGDQRRYSQHTVKQLKKYQRQLTRMSAAFALLVDASLFCLRGSLKRRERISARLGDILSQLYLASAVSKYFHESAAPEDEIAYVCWGLQQCLYKMQQAIDELLGNFPLRWVGKLLSRIIFPWGVAYTPPIDALQHEIVQLMLTPSAIRDRLTQFCYKGSHEHDPRCRLEQAFGQTAIIDPLWKKLHQAIQHGTIPNWYDFAKQLAIAEQLGVLTATEVQTLREFEKLRNEIIKVNEFSFDLAKVIV